MSLCSHSLKLRHSFSVGGYEDFCFMHLPKSPCNSGKYQVVIGLLLCVRCQSLEARCAFYILFVAVLPASSSSSFLDSQSPQKKQWGKHAIPDARNADWRCHILKTQGQI